MFVEVSRVHKSNVEYGKGVSPKGSLIDHASPKKTNQTLEF
jgi:hypothetical protein